MNAIVKIPKSVNATSNGDLGQQHAKLALDHLKRGEHQQAIACFESALALVWQDKGLRDRRRGMLVEARKAFREGLKIQPSNSACWLHRGRVSLDLGDHADALGDFREALRLQRTLLPGYWLAGLAYERIGDREAGLACVTQGLKIQPAAAGYLTRGMIASRASNYTQALGDLERALALDADCGLALEERGHLLTVGCHFEAARSDFDRLVSLEPDNARALAGRAMAHRGLGNERQALLDLGRAMRLDPNCLLAVLDASSAESLWRSRCRWLADYIEGIDSSPPMIAETLPVETEKVVLRVEAVESEPVAPAIEPAPLIEKPQPALVAPVSPKKTTVAAQCPGCSRFGDQMEPMPDGRLRCEFCRAMFLPGPAKLAAPSSALPVGISVPSRASFRTKPAKRSVESSSMFELLWANRLFISLTLAGFLLSTTLYSAWMHGTAIAAHPPVLGEKISVDDLWLRTDSKQATGRSWPVALLGEVDRIDAKKKALYLKGTESGTGLAVCGFQHPADVQRAAPGEKVIIYGAFEGRDGQMMRIGGCRLRKENE